MTTTDTKNTNVNNTAAAHGSVSMANVPNGTNVSVSTAPSQPVPPKRNLRYTSVEVVTPDSANIPVKARKEYVKEFRTNMKKTNTSTLEMCRVAYEAKQTLSVCDFADFCSDIGYKDDSASIRKFIVIGKVYPRLIQSVELLPDSWTSIYEITQIPASVFDDLVKKGTSFRSIKAVDLKQLLLDTKPRVELSHYLPQDKISKNFVFGKLMFTRNPDIIDWRAMRKALAEVEARLPVKFFVNSAAQAEWTRARDAQFEKTKQNYKDVEMRPDLWDFGREANNSIKAEVKPPEKEQAANTNNPNTTAA